MQALSYAEVTEDAFNSPLKNQQEEITTIWNNEVIPHIEQQIYYLNDLGVNYLTINNIQTLDINFFRELIQFCDETYINIPELDDILSNDLKVNIFGRFVYEFYAIDCITLLKYIVQLKEEITSLENLLFLSSNDLRNYLLNAISSKLELYRQVASLKPNLNMYTKYLFYSDMVDNDLERFNENYLQPYLTM